MGWYRCLIVGENFQLEVDGERRPMGFAVTRYVEASSEKEAQAGAMDMLRGDPVLQIPQGTPGMERARIFFEAIEPAHEPGANSGFAYFPMER